MRKEYLDSINKAKQYISKIKDPIHDLIHTKSVVNFSLKIASKYKEINPHLIEVAAWWHDVGRLYNSNHEKISAEMAFKSLKELNRDMNECNLVYNAILNHKWSMKPVTIEGEIIRDADKLDFISILRWKSGIKNNKIDELKEISELLPRLRNELLHLDISKQIYDNKIEPFKEFIKKQNKENFIKIKEEILKQKLKNHS